MATFYQVGGSVRDEILGRKSKDIDYSVEAESFDAMREAILERGGKIFLETPQYFTIRAHVPNMGACDFVLCRKDGEYTDGRRPDSVSMGTIYDDLARRDFTMNAIAKNSNGAYVDPFFGYDDIRRGLIRCVGSTDKRITEDALRMLRALRFSVTLGFDIHEEIRRVFQDRDFIGLLKNISRERIREELLKMFSYNTMDSLYTLQEFPLMMEFLFCGNIWLIPTMKER